MNIEGVAAIVTGGGSGLGAATAAMLAKRGARVTVLDLSRTAAEQVAKAIGGQAAEVDVTSEAAVAAALAEAEASQGVARLLVNCAGAAMAAKMVGEDNRPASLAPFMRLFEINVGGIFTVASHFAARLLAAPRLAGEEQGVIINTSSVAAYDGQVGHAAYAASKAAIIGLSLPMTRELAPHGVRVVTIAPGIFLTPMTEKHLPVEEQERQGRQVPFPSRLGRPDEFAMLVDSIIANPMINGETIRLDGALSLSAMRMGDVLVSGNG